MKTHDDLSQALNASIEDRARDAIKGVLEQVMEEEMDAQLQAKHRERTERHYGHSVTDRTEAAKTADSTG